MGPICRRPRISLTGWSCDMGTTHYAAPATNGDHAGMLGGAGADNAVALFLLPNGVAVGTRLKRENFEWSVEVCR